MPSARVRYAAGAGFLILVALGLALAQFDPVVIGAVMVVAVVLVALLEVAARAVTADGGLDAASAPVGSEYVERVEAQEPQPDTEPSVSERSARAILASAQPPLPAERPKPARRRFAQRTPAPSPPPPEPEPVVVPASPPREWNLWELQRAVRDAPGERHEEWTALLIHLREFANPDGNLSIEFDTLVRESFAPVLEAEPEPAAAP